MKIIIMFQIFLIFIISSSILSYSSENKQPQNKQLITLQKLWQTGEYWKVQTYDNHTSNGRYYAADFYYNNRNRSEIYKNSESGIAGRPILAPLAGNIFIHLQKISTNGYGQFPLINAVRVFQGLDPIPQNCFSMIDSLGVKDSVDMSLVLDLSSYRTLFSHLQIKSTYFNSIVQQKIRDGIRKLYNRTAIGNPRRVSVSVGYSAYVGEQIGTMYNWGIANNYHLHFQIFEAPGYSELNPLLGNAQNLSNYSNYNIEGQIILNSNYEASIGSGIYQYPAMMRRINLLSNDPIQVNTTWDGGGNINIRSTAGGTVIGSIPNSTSGVLLNPNPTTAKIYNGSTYHLWYNVVANSINGWIASEYFDKSTLQQYTITCSANPINGGTTSGCGTFSSGTQITITASSNSGWNFINWTEASNIVSTNSSYTFTVVNNRTLVANFQQNLLPPPVILSPGSATYPGPVLNTLTPTFQWQAVSGALRYGLYISIEPFGINNLVYDNDYISGTTFTLPLGYLTNSNKYRWNMTTFNSNGQNNGYSSHLYFQTYSFTSILQISNIIPEKFEIHQNYPNPFNPITTIKFDLPEISDIKIIFYDIKGSEIQSISENNLFPGQYSFQFDGSNMSSGIYLCRFISKEYQKTIKLNLIK